MRTLYIMLFISFLILVEAGVELHLHLKNQNQNIIVEDLSKREPLDIQYLSFSVMEH